MSKSYSYKNKSLENLRGEIWKEIPGWENYELSNFGRVKSLGRWVEQLLWAGPNRIQGEIFRPERILSQCVKISYSPFNKDSHYYLTFAVQNGKRRKGLRMARLMYYLFVEKFSLESRKLIIQYKDGDGLNVRPDNLLLTNHSAKVRKTLAKRRTPKIKKVTQFRLNGRKIKHYQSITEAARLIEGQPSRIWTAANKWPHYYKGYLWRMGERERTKPLDAPLTNPPKKVVQYSLKGRRLKTFPSLNQAAKAMGAKNSNLRKVLKGKCHTCKGYKWKWAG
ncbi:MAG TPA: NUMOD4 domain-containing protein [Puia sp.]|jgi:hypothetical protein|nr:NUMOD4 domain-containing protein [Puia sp.]